MKNLDFKYQNLKKAYARLQEASDLYDGTNTITRDGFIQRFEFTYELCHKTLLELLKYEGIYVSNAFPRTIFKVAYQNHFIDDETAWLHLLEDRNATSHVYSENMADEIAGRIQKSYVAIIGQLIEKIGEAMK